MMIAGVLLGPSFFSGAPDIQQLYFQNPGRNGGGTKANSSSFDDHSILRSAKLDLAPLHVPHWPGQYKYLI